MEQWKECRLGDILNFRRGYDLPKTKMVAGYIPVAGSNGIIGYHNEATPISPCITIGRSGNIGTPYIYEHCWAHNTVLYVDNFKGNNPYYLYYLLKTLPLASFGGGSAVPTLNRNHIHPIKVKFTPNIETQNRIVSVLSSLDYKIESNTKINSNLEEQAKALFKSWFIDFEPFKDGKFVDSELGKIPEGWKVRRLEDVSKIVGGGTPSKSKPQYFSHNGIHWITPKDLSLSHAKFTTAGADDITIEGYENSSAKLMPKGTVLFSSRAPIGYISIALNELCTNQGFKSVVPQELNTIYLYYYLKFHVKDIEAKASGSTFKEVSGSLMKSIPIVVPSANVVDKFENILTPIFNYQARIEKESSQLSSLRNSLLPKLMSGEIDV